MSLFSIVLFFFISSFFMPILILPMQNALICEGIWIEMFYASSHGWDLGRDNGDTINDYLH